MSLLGGGGVGGGAGGVGSLSLDNFGVQLKVFGRLQAYETTWAQNFVQLFTDHTPEPFLTLPKEKTIYTWSN